MIEHTDGVSGESGISLTSLPDDLADALRLAAFQRSRQAGDRGHYVYATGSDRYRNTAGEFGQFGEVRGNNGIIMVEPTPHGKASQGGVYRWERADGEPVVVPAVPDVLKQCIVRLKQGEADSDPLNDAEFERFLHDHNDGTQIKRINGPINRFIEDTHGGAPSGASIHESMYKAAAWAFREAAAGAYPAATALTELESAWREAWTNRAVQVDAAVTGGSGADVRASPWQGEFDQLMRDTAGAALVADPDEIRLRMNRDKDNMASDSPTGVLPTITLDSVTPEKVEWLWYPLIPLGKLTLFEGESDMGKSTVTLNWAATVTRGEEFPKVVMKSGELAPTTQHYRSVREPSNVLLVGIEDDIADTVVPRLRAAGADLSRVITLDKEKDGKGNYVPMVLPRDISRLRDTIRAHGVKLVIIDPITAFLDGNVKTGDDPSVRQALTPLAELAQEFQCAFVLLKHLNKSRGASAKDRSNGSVAWGAVCRSQIVVSRIPESEPDNNDDVNARNGENRQGEVGSPGGSEPVYAIARTKGNLSKEHKSIGYRLDSWPNDLDVAYMTWTGVVDLSADQLVEADRAQAPATKASPTRARCQDLLRELLADGPRQAGEIQKEIARIVGCSEKTVANAYTNMGGKAERVRADDGTTTRWMWQLAPCRLVYSADGDGRAERAD